MGKRVKEEGDKKRIMKHVGLRDEQKVEGKREGKEKTKKRRKRRRDSILSD